MSDIYAEYEETEAEKEEYTAKTLEELKEKMKAAIDKYDSEAGHQILDALLLSYINDEEVTKIFDDAEKWYA